MKYSFKNADPIDFKSLYTFWNPKVGEGLKITISISSGDKVWAMS